MRLDDRAGEDDARFSRVDLIIGKRRVTGLGKDVSHLVRTALHADGPCGFDLLGPGADAAIALRDKFQQFKVGQWALFRERNKQDEVVGALPMTRGIADFCCSEAIPKKKDPRGRFEIDEQTVLKLVRQGDAFLMAVLCRFPEKNLPLKVKLPANDDPREALTLMTALFDLSQLPFLTQRYQIDPSDSEMMAVIEAQTTLIGSIRDMLDAQGAKLAPALDTLPFVTTDAVDRGRAATG